ncbi:bifunctional riboflavin kinase/FAD synthetase [Streptococcus sp. S784/96/1]|uniref:bifunctional riboflavin kinase/FAD synthetase n=1 Tax=Streptococcus sp. S784/96/1 TaxID=2653499 RepID=UPI001389E841|nr:bifunctional riboflavin kinase/FAD synthetase [Streptococcus sp. S784/96/1]
MNIITINDYHDLVERQATVLVLGYFDGLHLGHKALFDKAREIAERKKLPITVLTFHESPKLTFARFTPDLLLHLAYPEKRYAKFEEYGVDYLYLMNFTSEFAKTSSDDFIKNYIEKLQAQDIVIGFDYQFGHNKTDSDYLARNTTAQVHTVGEIQFEGEKISSTRIREAVTKGNIELANQLLGYTFTTRGIVVHGDARGRTIGYPTANVAPLDRTYLPSDGVYVTDVCVKGKTYRAMTSIGQNVTFGGTELRLEAHIFDFMGEIYGEEIEISWLYKIRDMVKFSGIDDLIAQLEKDEQFSKNWA